jgi:hypothetical protein
MSFNIADEWYVVRYTACRVEDGAIRMCGHEHDTIAGALGCVVPDGGSFVRRVEFGVTTSLSEREFIDFLKALVDAPWASQRPSLRMCKELPSSGAESF